jgi:coenzyme F420-dependent glucose-6-phosphate dehydrogenase
MPRYFHFCAQEQFPPDDLLRQAVEAERAGFDGIGCSDHLQPWWEPGESGHAWVWLGAAAQATPTTGTTRRRCTTAVRSSSRTTT